MEAILQAFARLEKREKRRKKPRLKLDLHGKKKNIRKRFVMPEDG